MASVTINRKLLRDERMPLLMQASGRGWAELLGLLATFWLRTREAGLGVLPVGACGTYLPLPKADAEQFTAHLCLAGYLVSETPGAWTIVDNTAFMAKRAHRVEMCRKAGQISAAKRSKKVRKKRVVASDPKAAPLVAPARHDGPPPSVLAWHAYAAAYSQRWGMAPVSNATVRGQMAAIIKRIGMRAIEVMPFYVSHNDSFYVLKQHPVGLALKDCESLATQCAMQRPVTSREVRAAEKELGQYQQLEDIRAGRI